MFIVMGATGKVGRAVADTLLQNGQAVTILTRYPEKADDWREKGAAVVAADAEDVASLKSAFRNGRRAFLLNPPAAPATNTDATELRTIANILAALEGSGLEMVVAASTYGARPGRAIGDLSTLWELEEGLRRQPIPAAINRGAYYMSNWMDLARTVRDSGKLPSMYPANTQIPMVAPQDLGKAAAVRLLEAVSDTQTHYVEGPRRYTPQDVADAFAEALGRDVDVDVKPRQYWEESFRKIGFSEEAARAYTRMTAESLDTNFNGPERPVRGATTLQQFVRSHLAV